MSVTLAGSPSFQLQDFEMFTNLDKFYYLSLYLVKQAKGKGGSNFCIWCGSEEIECMVSQELCALYPENHN